MCFTQIYELYFNFPQFPNKNRTIENMGIHSNNYGDSFLRYWGSTLTLLGKYSCAIGDILLRYWGRTLVTMGIYYNKKENRRLNGLTLMFNLR